MTVYIGLVFIIILILHHIVHEYGHVLIAKINGEEIEKIEWFPFSGLLGTRVFYKNEPKLDEVEIEKKWGVIASAGFITTLMIGYLIIGSYIIFKNINSKLFIITTWIGSIVFFVNDPIYFILGGIFEFGDVKGVIKAFCISRWVVMIISVIILLFNILLIKGIWY